MLRAIHLVCLASLVSYSACFSNLPSRSLCFRDAGSSSFSARRSSSSTVLQNAKGADGDSEEDNKAVGGKGGSNPVWFLSQETIDSIKNSVSIVSVVETYGLEKFKRTSSESATAVCPFHDDNNPSLNIDDKRKIFKCFSCGTGGDVFKFVRDYSELEGEKLNFIQSVKYVSETFGDVEIDFASSKESSVSQEKRKVLEAKKERILLCNAVAADYFGKSLVKVAYAGQARQLLRQRGLSPTTVQRFALGFAPDTFFQRKAPRGQGSLLSHLLEAGFSREEIIDSGLVKKCNPPSRKDVKDDQVEDKEKDAFSDLIDTFRGRIMVPIFDKDGKHVLAFGGRILPSLERNSRNGYKAPKYLNSPETLVFQKKKELFGLHTAREALSKSKSRKSIIIVEGYMDAISLWNKGVRAVAASMGTALTYEQLASAAQALAPSSGQIILCLDNDEAGKAAVEKLCKSGLLEKVAAEFGAAQIVVASLPDDCKDPADFMEALGVCSLDAAGAAFKEQVLDKSIDWISWMLERVLSRYDSEQTSGPGSFADLCEQISDFLSGLKSGPERSRRAHDVAGKLSSLVARASSSSPNATSDALRIQLETDLVDMVAKRAARKDSIGKRVEAVSGYDEKNKREVMSTLMSGGGSSEDNKLSSEALKLKRGNDELPRLAGRTSTSARGTRTKMIRKSTQKRPPLLPHFDGFQFQYDTDEKWLGVKQERWKRGRADDNSWVLGYREKDTVSPDGVTMLRATEETIYFNSNDYVGDQLLTDEASRAGYLRSTTAGGDGGSSLLRYGTRGMLREDVKGKALLAEELMLRNLVHFPSTRTAMRSAISASLATGAPTEIQWSSDDRQWLFNQLVKSEEALEHMDVANLRSHLLSRDDAPESAFGKTEGFIQLKEDKDHGDAVMNAVSVHSVGNCTIVDAVFADADADAEPLKQEGGSVVEQVGGLKDAIGTQAIDVKAVTIQDSNGSLDRFFVDYREVLEESDQTLKAFRAELQVQESLATLLRATALSELAQVRRQLVIASKLLDKREAFIERVDQDSDKKADIDSGIKVLDDMNLDELQSHCLRLLAEVQRLYQTAQQLEESGKRISSRLMDYCEDDASEGRMSRAQQQQVAKLVDDYVANLPEDWQPAFLMNTEHLHTDDSMGEKPDDGPLVTSSEYEEAGTEEALQEDLIEIVREWSEWIDDEYSWSPDHARQLPLPDDILEKLQDSVGNDESPEETLSRMERDWSELEREVTPTNRDSPTEASATMAKRRWSFDKEMIGEASTVEHSSRIVDVRNQTNAVEEEKSWE